MTEQLQDDGWPARLDAVVAGARRRREERQAQRDQHAAARTAGLRARHAAKLSRTRSVADSQATGLAEGADAGPIEPPPLAV